ncbi:MAG: protein kinase [Myxococcota bacterium]
MHLLIAQRYQLGARLGAGASGEVYAAIDQETGSAIALKLIFAHLSESEENVVRFERQCRLLAGLNHPAVIDIHDWGFDEGRKNLFLTMERLSGRTLGEWMQSDSISTPQLMSWFVSVLDGLAAAHEAGMVHRDVKPDNIFVVDGPTQVSKLIDFGLVRQVDGTGPTQTQMGLGTPTYMAPEQAMSARTVSYPADVWSAGVVLYRLVSGRVPFMGDGPYETMIRVVSEDAPPLTNVPSRLEDLIMACLSKTPSSRPANARVLTEELERLLKDPRIAGWLSERPRHRGSGRGKVSEDPNATLPAVPWSGGAPAGAPAEADWWGPSGGVAVPHDVRPSTSVRPSRWASAFLVCALLGGMGAVAFSGSRGRTERELRQSATALPGAGSDTPRSAAPRSAAGQPLAPRQLAPRQLEPRRPGRIESAMEQIAEPRPPVNPRSRSTASSLSRRPNRPTHPPSGSNRSDSSSRSPATSPSASESTPSGPGKSASDDASPSPTRSTQHRGLPDGDDATDLPAASVDSEPKNAPPRRASDPAQPGRIPKVQTEDQPGEAPGPSAGGPVETRTPKESAKDSSGESEDGRKKKEKVDPSDILTF